ncbi:melatonin receptor type 1A-like [Asterias amurensis]|uniref:melatonin receptor type 1A-like n=1 Tax=Asterias amurensis TaxID=7602 RepID=UPI003AB83950
MEPIECSLNDTLNLTTNGALILLYNSTDKVVIPVILPVIFALCLLFNFIFLFAVFRVSEVRSDTTVYLIHLALADFIFMFSHVCFYMLSFLRSPVKGHLSFTHPMECVLSIVSIITGYVSSIALVTMMSFERYLAICHPLKHLKIRGRERTLKIIAFCWLIGFIWSVAVTPSHATLQTTCVRWPDDDAYQMFPSALTSCTFIGSWAYHYSQAIVILPWFISMFSNGYMYARIIQALNKRRGANGRTETDRKAVQIRNQAAKMLIVNGVVFFICQSPYTFIVLIIWMYRITQIDNPIYEFLINGGSWLMYLPQYINTILNPVIYGVINRQYRAAFVRAFHLKASTTRHQRTLHPVHAISPTSNTAAQPSSTEEGDNDTESMKGTWL